MQSATDSRFGPFDFVRFLAGTSMAAMVGLIFLQEAFGAGTTWLVIQIARDITEEELHVGSFVWIVATQTLSYLAGAVSWIYAERAGFGAFGHYMLHFSRQNRFQTSLLTEAERRLLLEEWNDNAASFPEERCLHELFEGQVARTPDAIAVVYEHQALQYSELNARANKLAHHLRRLGVGPDVLVGICVERSLEMVVGLLGILKAGGKGQRLTNSGELIFAENHLAISWAVL